MNLSLKQSLALDYCQKFFREKVSKLKIDCVILYGSATYPNCFIEDMSDLDILVFSKDATSSNLATIARNVSEAMQNESTQKPPIILQDHIGNRIEFDLIYNGISIDCTIMSSIMMRREDMLSDIVRDSAELLIGSILIWGKPIIGTIEDCIISDINLHPYYSDEIRDKRLSIIGQYLITKINRIKFMLNNNDISTIDYFFRYRPVFLKWIFCYYRQYPVNFYKHLPMQLKQISQISDTERSILMLDSSDTINANIENFINFYNAKFNEFKQ